MQHYRAPTRLLDWTYSPFVAAYFAFAEVPTEDSVAVWAINARECRRRHVGTLLDRPWDHLGTSFVEVRKEDGTFEYRRPAMEQSRMLVENELIRWVEMHGSTWPLPVIPFVTDQRMSAQQTVFTVIGAIN